ncbi:MAG: YcgN family cysteine cluster protein [Rhodospirillaceae bacterium]|nr:MAG: YcgN family cysteine cluster protein [Rhodospirillaceae bacterium]
MADDLPFWKTTKLGQMSRAQWESLCDGCGKCCLNKLIDDDTEELFFTNVACRQLDLRNCRCKDYAHRHDVVPDCIKLTPRNLAKINWLPETCAYRLIRDGKDLPWWHPLVSGDPTTVHRAGISVRGRAVTETKAGPLEDHIVDWS